MLLRGEEAIITNYGQQGISKVSRDECDMETFAFNVLQNKISHLEKKRLQKDLTSEYLN